MSELEQLLSRAAALLREGSVDQLTEARGDALKQLLSPRLVRELREAREQTREQGWAVLALGESLSRGGAPVELACVAMACGWGRPSRTNPHHPRLAWPVTPDLSTTRTTFSQTSGEAGMHTDSQYFQEPEPLFALFCLRADAPGLGSNQLVDLRALIYRLERERPELVQQLREPYPFRVPSIFCRSGRDEEVELLWAPIVSEGILRYRLDTLEDACALPGVSISDPQREALQVLSEEIERAPRLQYHLQPGELLLVDNHRMLHARTAFTSPHRFLYRVRVREN